MLYSHNLVSFAYTELFEFSSRPKLVVSPVIKPQSNVASVTSEKFDGTYPDRKTCLEFIQCMAMDHTTMYTTRETFAPTPSNTHNDACHWQLCVAVPPARERKNHSIRCRQHPGALGQLCNARRAWLYERPVIIPRARAFYHPFARAHGLARIVNIGESPRKYIGNPCAPPQWPRTFQRPRDVNSWRRERARCAGKFMVISSDTSFRAAQRTSCLFYLGKLVFIKETKRDFGVVWKIGRFSLWETWDDEFSAVILYMLL